MSIARIWPPVVDVLTLVAVRVMAGRCFQSLSGMDRCWCFALANGHRAGLLLTQAVSVFLAVAIYAIAVRRPR